MWSFLSNFIVRSTGFPQHLMDSLSFSASVNSIQNYLEIERKHERDKSWFLSNFDNWVARMQLSYQPGDPVFKIMYKIRKKIVLGKSISIENWPDKLSPGEEWFIQYEKNRESIIKERALLHDTLRKEWKEKTNNLHKVLKIKKIQEAIAHSNPEVWKTMDSYLKKSMDSIKPSRKRYEERVYISYLQRFLFKNDTTSFFGPLNYGSFEEQNEKIKFNRTGKIPTARRTFLAYWAVEALAKTISKEKEWKDYIPLSLHDSFYMVDDGIVHTQKAKKIMLDKETIQILKECKGEKSTFEIINSCSENVKKKIDLLVSKKIVIREFRISPSKHHLIERLIAFVHSLPESDLRKKWVDNLKKFEGWQSDYSNSNAAQKVSIMESAGKLFATLTGLNPVQSHGKLYADKYLFCEECAGDITSFSISTKLKRNLENEISPLLDWGNTIAVKKKMIAQKYAMDLYQTHVSGYPDKKIPFLFFLLELQKHKFELKQSELDPTRLLEKWYTEESLMLDKIELTEELVQDQIEEHLISKHLSVTSPDMMLNAKSVEDIEKGDFQWVIGEVHWGTQGISNLLYFHPNKDNWINEVKSALNLLPNGEHLVNVVLKQRAGKNFFLEMFERSITLMGLSEKDKEYVQSFSELYVIEEDGELIIKDKNNKRIIPHMGEPDNPIALVFSEPSVVVPKFKRKGHLPRIVYRNIVLQRETWTIPTEEWNCLVEKDETERYVHVWRLKEKFGLPDEVFVRVKSEMKPFYVNFQNFFLVDLLLKYLRSEEMVIFSELLPNRDSSWFYNRHGTYCCELRGIMIKKVIENIQEKVECPYAINKS